VTEFQPANGWPAPAPDIASHAKSTSFLKIWQFSSRFSAFGSCFPERYRRHCVAGLPQGQAVLGEAVAVIGAGLVGG